MKKNVLRLLRSSRGITFIELTVVTALFGLITLVGYQFYTNSFKLRQVTAVQLEIHQEGRTILNAIIKSLHQAKTGTVIIDARANQPPYSWIEFESITGRKYGFYQEGNELYREYADPGFSSNRKILTRNLRSLYFCFPTTGNYRVVSVSITIEKGTYSGQTKSIQLVEENIRIMN